MQQHAHFPPTPGFGNFNSHGAPFQPSGNLYPQLPAFDGNQAGSSAGPSVAMGHNPAPFQPQRTGGEAPFVDIPVSVSVPASMAERHRAQYEELARLQRQELLQLAGQPSPYGNNQGPSNGRYNNSQSGGPSRSGNNGRSYSGHENGGMFLGVGEQDRPSPGSPGSQGQRGYHHGMGAHDGPFGAIDGLYQDVKKRRVEPVYDASE